MLLWNPSHHSSLSAEALVSLPGIEELNVEKTLEDSFKGGPFRTAAIKPEFHELLHSCSFRQNVNADNLSAGVVLKPLSADTQDMAQQCRTGIYLAQLLYMAMRQPNGQANGPLLMNMWGTGCVIRECPEVAAILRWWDPEKVKLTTAFGEANHGPWSGYVWSAVPSKDVLKWAIPGMRVLFPYRSG